MRCDGADGKFDEWSTGVTFRLPLGNNQANAQRSGTLRAPLRGATSGGAAPDRHPGRASRGAAVESSAKSIDAAAKARELAERNLDAEQKKFANGMSTNYQVLQIQSDLAAAQAAELQSRSPTGSRSLATTSRTGRFSTCWASGSRKSRPRRNRTPSGRTSSG